MNGPNNPIKWCDYTWNPIKGLCPVSCPYCYARRIYDRFHYDPTIRLDEKELQAPYKLKKPSRIFVGSTIELYTGQMNPIWLYRIIQVVEENPQHIFQFLTKFPHLIFNIFPDNCWIGTTVTTASELSRIEDLKRHHQSKKPIFMKDNLKPYWHANLRKEFPNAREMTPVDEAEINRRKGGKE